MTALTLWASVTLAGVVLLVAVALGVVGSVALCGLVVLLLGGGR